MYKILKYVILFFIVCIFMTGCTSTMIDIWDTFWWNIYNAVF